MKRAVKTMDGNQAAAHVAYAYTETAAVYPITPSSGMAEYMSEWAHIGRKNIFGQCVTITEMQSEAGAAGAIHGALIAGGLASTFTSSQGLLLMLPNLYRMAGEFLPGVLHVSARSIATHALSIFGDHSDIYACRQTGAAILSSCSVQEVMDIAPVAHLAALRGHLPFVHFFDGFRTSHEMQKIEVWDDETLAEFFSQDDLYAHRTRAIHPYHAKMMGSAQNPDIFFQCREASNSHYEALPDITEEILKRVNAHIGTSYGLFEYSGAPDAEHVVIAMGSVCETIAETVRHMNAQGASYGLVKVRLYRPFSRKHLLAALPKSVRRITVLDRTKEPGAQGEPLFLDVLAALQGSAFSSAEIFSGRYGLSSKDVTPEQIAAILQNTAKRRFTIGITDDVTHLSLPVGSPLDVLPKDTICCKFWGLGGDGTVSANKSTIKIIGDHTDLYAQAYFEYDSKKSRGLTISHLRFGKSPIHAPYLIRQADFSACHNPIYMHKYDIVQEIKDGGTFLLCCSPQEQPPEKFIPGQARRYLAEHHIRLFIIDAITLAKKIGLGGKVNTILQAAFFKVTGILSEEKALSHMKESIRVSYGKKGGKIAEMNETAIMRAMDAVIEIPVPDAWRFAEDEPLDVHLLPDRAEVLDYVVNIQKPMVQQRGDALPVSAFLPYADGGFPMGTTAHERRNVATEIPVWIPENCIQCGLCSYVCPHAVIRLAVMDDAENAAAPQGMSSIPMNGAAQKHFSVIVSEVDCTGCGSCVGVCPGKKGKPALELVPIHEKQEHQEYFDYAKILPRKSDVLTKFPQNTIKGSQLRQPLLEFHGACAGCGETPYARLLTQLFGERMYIANATGCSSIWAHSAPSAAYTVTPDGKGPAWSNSLFEDGAEFGYGMWLAQQHRRNSLHSLVEDIAAATDAPQLETTCRTWLASFDNAEEGTAASSALIAQLEERANTGYGTPQEAMLLKNKDDLVKKSYWVFGGDGFAYDIGFGGLDHVLASGANVNIFVFDTEVYSNTGGQSSKATPLGAAAKFASGGKPLPKKNLAAMMMTYGYVYVAQIAMGANYRHTLTTLLEAERYPGPSLIIAYAPCISHGIRSGMGSSQHEQAKAVTSGYWNLFRYNPSLRDEGKNPLILDSKPDIDAMDEFLKGEIRFQNTAFHAQAQANAAVSYQQLLRLKDAFEPTK